MRYLKLFKNNKKKLTKSILKECFVDFEDMGLRISYNFTNCHSQISFFSKETDDFNCIEIDMSGLINFKDILENVKFVESFLKFEYGFKIVYINLEYIRYNDEGYRHYGGKYENFLKLGNSGILNKIVCLQIQLINN